MGAVSRGGRGAVRGSVPNEGTGDAAAARPCAAGAPPGRPPSPPAAAEPHGAPHCAAHRFCSSWGSRCSCCPAPLGAPQPDPPIPQLPEAAPAAHRGKLLLPSPPRPAGHCKASARGRAEVFELKTALPTARRGRPPSAPRAAAPGRTAGLPRAMGAAPNRPAADVRSSGPRRPAEPRRVPPHSGSSPVLSAAQRLQLPAGTEHRHPRCPTPRVGCGLCRRTPALPAVAALSVPPRCCAGTQRGTRRHIFHRRAPGSVSGASPPTAALFAALAVRVGAQRAVRGRCVHPDVTPTPTERCPHRASLCSAGIPPAPLRSPPRPGLWGRHSAPRAMRSARPDGAPRPPPLKGLRAAAGPSSPYGAGQRTASERSSLRRYRDGGRGRRCRGAEPLGAVCRGEFPRGRSPGRLSAPRTAGTFGAFGTPRAQRPQRRPLPQRRASGASEALPDAVQERSPTGGPPLAMLPFRVPVVATAGSDVFEDEREELARNTRQPGCKPPRCGAAFPARITASFSSTFRPLGAVPHLRGAPNGQSGAPDGAAVPRGPRRRSYRGGRRSAVPSAAALRVPPPAVSAPRPRLRVRPTEKTAFIRFCFAVGLASAPLSLAELRRLLRNSRTAPEGSPPRGPPWMCERRARHRCDELWLRSAGGGRRSASVSGSSRAPPPPPLHARFPSWGGGWTSPCAAGKKTGEKGKRSTPRCSAHPRFVGCGGAMGPRSGAQHVPPLPPRCPTGRTSRA